MKNFLILVFLTTALPAQAALMMSEAFPAMDGQIMWADDYDLRRISSKQVAVCESNVIKKRRCIVVNLQNTIGQFNGIDCSNEKSGCVGALITYLKVFKGVGCDYLKYGSFEGHKIDSKIFSYYYWTVISTNRKIDFLKKTFWVSRLTI